MDEIKKITMDKPAPKPKPVKTFEDLEKEVKGLRGQLNQVMGYANIMKETVGRLELALARAIEPSILWQFACWSDPTQYVNERAKKVILAQMAKLLSPVAMALAKGKPEKQLTQLCNQAYNSFLQRFGLFDYDLKIKWDGHEFKVRDKNGIDPFVIQVDSGEKSHYHRASLQDLVQAIEKSKAEAEEVEKDPEEPASTLEETLQDEDGDQ